MANNLTRVKALHPLEGGVLPIPRDRMVGDCNGIWGYPSWFKRRPLVVALVA
jgi:hypothetical protein